MGHHFDHADAFVAAGILSGDVDKRDRVVAEMRNVAVSESEMLTVNVTEEGVIFDAYRDGKLVGTRGMTFEEWFDAVEEKR
jgi:hypothetical protein